MQTLNSVAHIQAKTIYLKKEMGMVIATLLVFVVYVRAV